MCWRFYAVTAWQPAFEYSSENRAAGNGEPTDLLPLRLSKTRTAPFDPLGRSPRALRRYINNLSGNQWWCEPFLITTLRRRRLVSPVNASVWASARQTAMVCDCRLICHNAALPMPIATTTTPLESGDHIPSAQPFQSSVKYCSRFCTSMLTLWYRVARLPGLNRSARMCSMSSDPMALVKIGMRYCTPSFDG